MPPRMLTVFHVNPLHEGVIPIDMDTADRAGDAFFDLRSKVLPIECADNSSWWADDCSNQEVVASDLVITQLQLEIKGSKAFGPYGRCNVCGPDGQDPFSGLNCTAGEYLCTCGKYWTPKDCTAQTAVGVENISRSFGGADWGCTWESYLTAPWRCWSWPVVHKTGGMWYSTTAAGFCGAPGADLQTCTWDAHVVKVVNKSCSDGLIYDAFEAYDRFSGGRCFDECPQRQRHPWRARNTSDTCWIYCFYQTVLGASGLLPSGGVRIGGMPRDQILAAFDRPFKPAAEGGCPALPPPPLSLSLNARSRASHRRGVYWRRAALADNFFLAAARAEVADSDTA